MVFIQRVVPVDLNVFLGAGRAVAAGRNPYPLEGSSAVWSGSAFVYPWMTAWLFVPMAALPAHGAAMVMAAVTMGCVALGVWVVAGPKVSSYAGVLLAGPTLDGLQIGTMNPLLFVGLCLAWRWRDRAIVAGTVLGLVVAMKMFCWPLMIWLVLTRRWSAAGWAAAVSAVLLVVGWATGPIGPTAYVRLLAELGSHEVYQSASLQGLLVTWGATPIEAKFATLSVGAVLMIDCARRGDAMLFAGAVLTALITSPVVWHHYYLLCAAPLLVRRRGAAAYLLLGWLCVAARPVDHTSWVWLQTIQRPCAALLLATLTIHRRVIVVGLRRSQPWHYGALALTALVVSATLTSLNREALVDGLSPGQSVATSIAPLIISLRRRPKAVAEQVID